MWSLCKCGFCTKWGKNVLQSIEWDVLNQIFLGFKLQIKVRIKKNNRYINKIIIIKPIISKSQFNLHCSIAFYIYSLIYLCLFFFLFWYKMQEKTKKRRIKRVFCCYLVYAVWNNTETFESRNSIHGSVWSALNQFFAGQHFE